MLPVSPNPAQNAVNAKHHGIPLFRLISLVWIIARSIYARNAPAVPPQFFPAAVIRSADVKESSLLQLMIFLPLLQQGF